MLTSPRFNSRTATRSGNATEQLSMPVYLFTYHAYGTWLPDRQRGYVKRKQGVLPADHDEAIRYRTAMKAPKVVLHVQHQQLMIETLVDSQAKQHFRCHGAATDTTHLHALVSWTDNRRAVPMRAAVKSSLSRAMNRVFGKRDWLSEGGSRKRVQEERHFEHLLGVYLPKHSGLVWIEGRDYL